MNNSQLSALLDRYLDGKCSSEEVSAIDNWYSQYEGNENFIDGLTSHQKKDLKLRMLKDIQGQDIENLRPSTQIPVKRLYQYPLLKIAAAVIVMLSITFFWIAKDHNAERQSKMVKIFNTTKSIYKQMLPDSSVAYLNPGASLIYPEVFEAETRSVSMIGDCFFEITKNPQRPFIIASPRMVTKVWGTSFRILDDQILGDALVSVVTGKVSVSKKEDGGRKIQPSIGKNEMILYPKEEARISATELRPVKNNEADLSELSIYNHIDLSFNGETLSEIVNVLNQKFDTKIKIEDKQISNLRMNADLSGLNLPEVMDVLKTSMKFEYQIMGDQILLTMKK